MPPIERRHILILVALLFGLAMVYWSSSYKDPKLSQQDVLKWIQEGYPSQFCTNIFPNLESCLTITVTECESIAEQQVQPCVNQLAETMPQSMTKEESKKYYAQASACFEQNMREVIMQSYLQDSDECRAKMQ